MYRRRTWSQMVDTAQSSLPLVNRFTPDWLRPSNAWAGRTSASTLGTPTVPTASDSFADHVDCEVGCGRRERGAGARAAPGADATDPRIEAQSEKVGMVGSSLLIA